jgi:hypothetical protein
MARAQLSELTARSLLLNNGGCGAAAERVEPAATGAWAGSQYLEEETMTRSVYVIDEFTPLGFRVVCSREYWNRITSIKHPPMRDRLADVAATLSDPDEVRRSVNDPDVLLFHRRIQPRFVCAVVKRSGDVGYLIRRTQLTGSSEET